MGTRLPKLRPWSEKLRSSILFFLLDFLRDCYAPCCTRRLLRRPPFTIRVWIKYSKLWFALCAVVDHLNSVINTHSRFWVQELGWLTLISVVGSEASYFLSLGLSLICDTRHGHICGAFTLSSSTGGELNSARFVLRLPFGCFSLKWSTSACRWWVITVLIPFHTSIFSKSILTFCATPVSQRSPRRTGENLLGKRNGASSGVGCLYSWLDRCISNYILTEESLLGWF